MIWTIAKDLLEVRSAILKDPGVFCRRAKHDEMSFGSSCLNNDFRLQLPEKKFSVSVYYYYCYYYYYALFTKK